jgi:hypothetical protein
MGQVRSHSALRRAVEALPSHLCPIAKEGSRGPILPLARERNLPFPRESAPAARAISGELPFVSIFQFLSILLLKGNATALLLVDS